MLAPNVTWGELREAFLKDVENETVSTENPLHDVKFRQLSAGKKNEDFVWPEEAKLYNETIGQDDPEAVTAAGEPMEEMEDDPMLSPLYFTVDDSGSVLELVKADDDGLFIRLEGEWVDISDEDEFPTVYEQTIVFANDKSVGIWDAEFEDRNDLKESDIKDYIIK